MLLHVASRVKGMDIASMSDACKCMRFVYIKELYSTKKTIVNAVSFKGYESHGNFVLKSYSKEKAKLRLFLREVEIHSQLNHKNIVKLYVAWEGHDSFNMLLENASHGDMFDLIYNAPFDIRMNKQFIFEKILNPLVDAIYYLHSHDIAHTDIKPENVAFDQDGRLLLLDFGLAVRLYTDTYEAIFTQEYRAPEVCNGNVDKCKIDPKKLDIWCLGLLLYELVAKKCPSHIIKNGAKDINIKSKRLAKIIKECTRTNPDKRPDIAWIIKLLRCKELS